MSTVTEVNRHVFRQEAMPRLSRSTVRGRIEALLDAGYTTARLASESGLSRSDIKAWQKWDASDEADRALAVWLEGLELEASRSDPGWFETPTGARFQGGFEQAQSDPSIFICSSVAGCGKTTARLHYAESVAPPGSVIHVGASRAVRSLPAVLELLSREVGGTGHAYRTLELFEAIARQLHHVSLIIIDEAQHLEYDALEGLRSFLDDYGVGLAFLGNEKTYKDFSGTGRAAQFAQLSSRVGRRMMVTKPEEGDIDAMLEAWGVKGRREREFMQVVGAQAGALRVVSRVIKAARELGGMDLVCLKGAAKYIGLGVQT